MIATINVTKYLNKTFSPESSLLNYKDDDSDMPLIIHMNCLIE
jgi:hypothetical protein